MHDWCATEGTHTHRTGSKMSCLRPLQRAGPAGRGGHTATPTGPRCACAIATSCSPLGTSARETTARRGRAPLTPILYQVKGPHTLSPYTDKCMRQVLTLILTEVLINLHKLTHNQYRRMLNLLCSVYKQVQEHTHTLFPWHKYSHTHCLSKVWGSQAWAITLALHHHMLAALTHFQESCDNEICYWASKGHLPGQRSGSLSGQHF